MSIQEQLLNGKTWIESALKKVVKRMTLKTL